VSFAGLIASIKLHNRDWLVQYEWLTFGIIRSIHLNAVAYGWTSLAGLGLAMWMLPRLLQTTLQVGRFALLGAVLWASATHGPHSPHQRSNPSTGAYISN
jgi:cytochrome c oxidase cbb3-type subunit 1